MLALITRDPLAIVERFADLPRFLLLPSGGSVVNPAIGWRDGTYMLADLALDPPPSEFHSAGAQASIARDGATVTLTRTWNAAPIEDVRRALKRRIDDAAGRERLRHITSIPGQDLLYDRKAVEAHALASDPAPSPNPSSYPILAASVGIEAATLRDVGALVLQTETLWTGLAAAIERVRLGAKKAVTEATDVAAAVAVVDAIAWPA